MNFVVKTLDFMRFKTAKMRTTVKQSGKIEPHFEGLEYSYIPLLDFGSKFLDFMCFFLLLFFHLARIALFEFL